MGWAYMPTLNALDLADVCRGVRIESEGGAAFLDSGVQIPHRDGVHIDDQANYGPLNLTLRTMLRYTDPTGAVTHGDGQAGHVYENLSLIKREFAGPGLATLGRTVPHIGQVRALCKLTAPPTPAEQRHIYFWFLTVATGSWQDTAESSAVGNPPAVTTSGDRRIHDPIVVFSAAGSLTHTASDGVESVVTAAAGPTYPVTVDVGAGTVLDDTGADARGEITFTQPWWLRLEPDLAQTIATTVSVTVRWRNRWA